MIKLFISVSLLFLISFQPDNTYSFIKSKPFNEIYIIEGVYYDFGSSELLQEGVLDLKRVSDGMKSLTDIKIELTPYLDSIEYKKFGKKLATQRLMRVIEFLNKQKIPNSRISKREYQNKYLLPNNTEENRYLNRCVTIKVID